MTLLSTHIIYLFLASSYYHINPTNKSIVPDLVGVVTLNIAVLSYFIDPYIFILLYVLEYLVFFIGIKQMIYDYILLYYLVVRSIYFINYMTINKLDPNYIL